MKTAILSLAVLACALLFYPTRVDAGDDKGSVQVFSSSSNQRGGWLGVSIQDITSKMAKKKNLKNEDGAYVSDVLDDSPADSAGVKEGDVIVEFNGKTIDDAGDLLHAVQKSKPGTKTTIVVIRDNDKKSLAISVGKPRRNNHSSGFAFAPPVPPRMPLFGESRRWGLQLSELNEQLGEYFGAPHGRGLLVEQVEKKSSGAKAGFKAGDVITKVNKNSVEEFRDLSDTLDEVETGDKVEVEVIRKGTSTTLTVEIEDKDDPPSSFNFHFENVPDLEGFQPEGIQLRIQHPEGMLDLQNLKMQMDQFKKAITRVTV